jgi:hypothetical protein
MKRLLIWSVLSGCLFGVAPPAVAQDDSPLDRAVERTEERAARARDRAQRVEERFQERMRRTEERVRQRLNREFDGDHGAHLLFGEDYDLAEGSTTSEKIIVVGGTATINGHAQDDVVVVGGKVRLGPKAIVDGDVSLLGGSLDRDPAAQVDGDVHVAHVSIPWERGWIWPAVPRVGRIWWEGAALAFTIGRFVVVLLLSIAVVLMAPRSTASIAARVMSAPVGSAVAGFAGEMLFAPAFICLAIILIITIVGIPLLLGLPLLMAAFACAWVAGYAVITGLIGSRLRGTDWYVHGIGPIDVFLGSCVLSGVTIVGQALMLSPGWFAPFAMLVRGTGWTIEYIAWTVGLGAALMAWFRPGNGFNPGSVPPVVPPLPSPTAI